MEDRRTHFEIVAEAYRRGIEGPTAVSKETGLSYPCAANAIYWLRNAKYDIDDARKLRTAYAMKKRHRQKEYIAELEKRVLDLEAAKVAFDV